MDKPKRKFTPFRAIMACGREFCQQTSMHGFIHIAAPNRWWGERLLWAFATAAAIWGAVEISLGQWQRYNENPTVVALEKDFRSWQFCMPGLTLCAENKVDENKLPSVIKKYWNVDPQDPKYARYEHFVRDVANSSMLHLTDLLQHEGEDLEVDLYQLAVDVLPEYNIKPTWSIANLQVPWFTVMTEVGACYATNSLAIPDDAIESFGKPDVNQTSLFPLTCKYSSLNCYITIEVPVPILFYVHSPYDILNVKAAPFEGRPRQERSTEFSVIESGCGRGVRELNPRRRRCLYTDEPQARGRQVYSTNSCRRSCRNQEALRDCKCKPFYNHYEDGVACSLRGMRCLAERSAREAQRTTSEAARVKAAKHAARSQPIVTKGDTEVAPPANAVDSCKCPLMCVDALFEMLSSVSKKLDGPFSINGVTRVKVQAPRTRYTREIVFYFQDLIVSFGGATGLFLGASFISFVEIVFFAAEWLIGPARRDHKELPVKKTKVSHEQARIQHLNAILENQSLSAAPSYWHSHLHI
ncbi:uncharacterized protein LOC133531537 [Cydia pomonella]|uniref:uncharacterized protein LOC133531537 n=1 Tax=Cydia pomonella TaxID=82600 RepID=UPI002ADD8F37|nr:uncharacterized protein LOC133531537 [Cydia pomonella]